MDKPAQNIQDSFLNTARKDKTHVTIYLVSGVKLSGRIKSFDKYSLILENSNQEQLIFKHAISTVVTTKPHPAAGSPATSAQSTQAQPAQPEQTQAGPPAPMQPAQSAQGQSAPAQAQPAPTHAEITEG